jgi:hypothetical protein
MEATGVIAFPRFASQATDGVERDEVAAGAFGNSGRAILEIDAAIALVVSGAARRVRLTALPFVETVAATGLAHARAAGLRFAFERAERLGVVTVTVGPLD